MPPNTAAHYVHRVNPKHVLISRPGALNSRKNFATNSIKCGSIIANNKHAQFYKYRH